MQKPASSYEKCGFHGLPGTACRYCLESDPGADGETRMPRIRAALGTFWGIFGAIRARIASGPDLVRGLSTRALRRPLGRFFFRTPQLRTWIAIHCLSIQ